MFVYCFSELMWHFAALSEKKNDVSFSKLSKRFLSIKLHFYAIIVDVQYLEYPLSRTITMSSFLFGHISNLINLPYKSARYLELHYLELSPCRKIFSVPSVIFGLFPIRHLEHSNEVFEWIILFLSGIRMLITALTKLCSEVCSFFFSTSFRKQYFLS